MRRTLWLAVAAAVMAALVGGGQSAGAAEVPNSMAAAGDSITRAFDADLGTAS